MMETTLSTVHKEKVMIHPRLFLSTINYWQVFLFVVHALWTFYYHCAIHTKKTYYYDYKVCVRLYDANKLFLYIVFL